MIVSKAVSQAEQASAQSIISLVAMLAQAVANPVYTYVLYDPTVRLEQFSAV